MGDRHVSSTEVAPVASDNAPQDSASRNCKIRKCHSEKCNNVRDEAGTQDVIDLENLSATIYTETSDEDDTSEGDVERTETRLPLATGLGSFCGKELPSALHERARKLRSEMTSLREKLSKETTLWRKEKEEYQLLRERSDLLAFEEATAAARAAATAYAIESPLSGDLDNIDFTDQSIRELAILEYEKNLARYHDRYSYEQAEQRYNSYRRVLVDAYRHKLSEVERLCNEELENIQQNASCLQPFKEIASQWFTSGHGDSQRGGDDPPESAEADSKIGETSTSNDWCVYGKIDNEVNMIPEILSARFKRDEAT